MACAYAYAKLLNTRESCDVLCAGWISFIARENCTKDMKVHDGCDVIVRVSCGGRPANEAGKEPWSAL